MFLVTSLEYLFQLLGGAFLLFIQMGVYLHYHLRASVPHELGGLLAGYGAVVEPGSVVMAEYVSRERLGRRSEGQQFFTYPVKEVLISGT